jgi:type I restriction enzyme S subunit
VPETTSLKLLPENTVAIVVRGMILAHTFPVSVLRVPATINQDLKALLPRESLQPQFLANCLRAQAAAVLDRVSEAGHGTKRLDTEALRQIRVPQVPESLQLEFERRVQASQKLKMALLDSLRAVDQLFTSLQHRAFQGTL